MAENKSTLTDVEVGFGDRTPIFVGMDKSIEMSRQARPDTNQPAVS